MVQTQDNFKHANPTDENGEGFAQPKGVQTRAAIAKHLAAKLKIDQDMDPSAVYEQYSQLILDKDLQGGIKTHWDMAI